MKAQFVPFWFGPLAQFVSPWQSLSAGNEIRPDSARLRLIAPPAIAFLHFHLLYPDPIFGFRWIRQFGRSVTSRSVYTRPSPDDVDLEPISRFAPMFWTCNFNRPMMASVVQEGDQDLLVTACFYTQRDLCGVIWESADDRDHRLLRYQTDRDYSGCVLQFEWEAEGDVAGLDAVNGPVLTIEGRLPNGTPKIWYVRLWNYADPLTRTPTRAFIRMDFDDLAGGFLLPSEADPVYPGDIDRMFVSLVPSGYTGNDLPLAAPTIARVRLKNISATGPNSRLLVGATTHTGHGFRMATGYDDMTNLTPSRIMWTMKKLSYNKWLNHYVGMSHYFRLEWNSAEGRFVVATTGDLLNAAAAQWHQNLASLCKDAKINLIFSLSYELFNAHCPTTWRQMNALSEVALTGWVPPSALLSPCNTEAMTYLRDVALAFSGIQRQAGARVHFQIGEPWWWVNTFSPDIPTTMWSPCCYDAATVARYEFEFGSPPPTVLDVRASLSPTQQAFMAWCGARLAESTQFISSAVKAEFSDAVTYLLFYSPQVFGPGAQATVPLNMPTEWRFPAFDVLQLEDYDFVIENDKETAAEARDAINLALEYPLSRQHYFAGFVLRPADRDTLWPRVMDFASDARNRSVPEVFLWSYSQVVRDSIHPRVIVQSPLEGAPLWNKVLPRSNTSILVG